MSADFSLLFPLRLGLLALHLLHVELQLLALQNVPVSAAALARARRDRRIKPPGRKLVLEGLVEDARLAAGFQLARDVVALLDRLGGFRLRGLLLRGGSGVLLLGAALDAVVLRVPLLERRRVDLDDRGLHERLRAHELVVRGVVDDVEDARLARDGLRAPREVAVVEAERAELEVAAADADAADGDGRGELGVGRLAAELVPEEKRERGGEREREGEKREK